MGLGVEDGGGGAPQHDEHQLVDLPEQLVHHLEALQAPLQGRLCVPRGVPSY